VDRQRAPGGAAQHQGCSLQVDPIPHGPVKCVQRRSDRSEMTLLQHLCQMRSRRVLLPYSSDTAKVQPVRRNFGRHFLLFVAKDYQAIAPRLDGSQLAGKARREGTQLQKFLFGQRVLLDRAKIVYRPSGLEIALAVESLHRPSDQPCIPLRVTPLDVRPTECEQMEL
jgi:hypothetical protein